MGEGAYGVVWKAVNKKTKRTVALKKVFKAFTNKTDAQRTFREVIILKQLKHKNIITLNDVHRAQNDVDLYLEFEFVSTDLHKVIKANILQTVHIQYIIY